MTNRHAGPVSIFNLLDFFFCMLGCVLLGTIWMNVPSARASLPAEVRMDGPREEDLGPAAPALEDLSRQLMDLQAESKKLDEAIRQAKGRARDTAEAWRGKVLEVPSLQEVLHAKVAEEDRLKAELAKVRRPDPQGGMGTPVAARTSKDPVFVELVGNRVVPVTKDHYRLEAVQVEGGKRLIVATRTAQGEAIDELKNPASAFLKTLQALKPEKEFLGAIVHADSFKAFRVVREIARSRNIAVGWTPHQGPGEKLIFGSGGQSVPEQP